VTFGVWVRTRSSDTWGHWAGRNILSKDEAIDAAEKLLEESTEPCVVSVYRFIRNGAELRSTCTVIWSEEKEEGNHAPE